MIKINLIGKEKMKECKKCGEEKSVECFDKDKEGKFGVKSKCKECRKKYDKKYRSENKKELNKKNIEYKRLNKEKVRNYPSKKKGGEYQKKYRQRKLNGEIVKIQREEKKCSICKMEKNINEFGKDKYSIDNHEHRCKECKCLLIKEYRNKEENKEKMKIYDGNRIRNNITIRLHKNISRAIGQALRRIGTSKGGGKTFDYLPYSIFQLKDHLESQFDDKMSWNNYGSYWHIDHIVPKSLFIYKTMNCEEFRKCWSLENLRPLEKYENMKKGNKIIFKEII